jgi:hypothetical protein
LTWSPLTRVSRYTLFSLAAMFLVFAVWALFGFAYPSAPLSFAMNAVSKVICFVVAVTFFLPSKEQSENSHFSDGLLHPPPSQIPE